MNIYLCYLLFPFSRSILFFSLNLNIIQVLNPMVRGNPLWFELCSFCNSSTEGGDWTDQFVLQQTVWSWVRSCVLTCHIVIAANRWETCLGALWTVQIGLICLSLYHVPSIYTSVSTKDIIVTCLKFRDIGHNFDCFAEVAQSQSLFTLDAWLLRTTQFRLSGTWSSSSFLKTPGDSVGVGRSRSLS